MKNIIKPNNFISFSGFSQIAPKLSIKSKSIQRLKVFTIKFSYDYVPTLRVSYFVNLLATLWLMTKLNWILQELYSTWDYKLFSTVIEKSNAAFSKIIVFFKKLTNHSIIFELHYVKLLVTVLFYENIKMVVIMLFFNTFGG